MSDTIIGLRNILEKIDAIASFSTWGQLPMEQTLEVVKDEIAQYKNKAGGAFSAMATPGQRRAYWAKVRAGEIGHGVNGYIRSGTLGRGWSVKLNVNVNNIEGVIANNTEYAPYVHSASQQQPFHAATRFQTDEGTLAATEGTRKHIWEVVIKRLL